VPCYDIWDKLQKKQNIYLQTMVGRYHLTRMQEGHQKYKKTKEKKTTKSTKKEHSISPCAAPSATSCQFHTCTPPTRDSLRTRKVNIYKPTFVPEMTGKLAWVTLLSHVPFIWTLIQNTAFPLTGFTTSPFPLLDLENLVASGSFLFSSSVSMSKPS